MIDGKQIEKAVSEIARRIRAEGLDLANPDEAEAKSVAADLLRKHGFDPESVARTAVAHLGPAASPFIMGIVVACEAIHAEGREDDGEPNEPLPDLPVVPEGQA